MTGVLVEFLGSGGVLMLAGVVLVKLEREWDKRGMGKKRNGRRMELE